jgi:hypothetical protein
MKKLFYSILLIFMFLSCKDDIDNKNITNVVKDGDKKIVTKEYNCRNIYVKEVGSSSVTFIFEYYVSDKEIRFKYLSLPNEKYTLKISNRNYVKTKLEESDLYESAEIEVIDLAMIQNSYSTKSSKLTTMYYNDNIKINQ